MHYDDNLTREWNIEQNYPESPDGVTKSQWAGYVKIHDEKRHKVMEYFDWIIYLFK